MDSEILDIFCDGKIYLSVPKSELTAFAGSMEEFQKLLSRFDSIDLFNPPDWMEPGFNLTGKYIEHNEPVHRAVLKPDVKETYGTVIERDNITFKTRELAILNYLRASYADHRLVSVSEIEDGSFILAVENVPSSGRSSQTMRLSRESLIGVLNTVSLYWNCKGVDMLDLVKESTAGQDIGYSFSHNMQLFDPANNGTPQSVETGNDFPTAEQAKEQYDTLTIKDYEEVIKNHKDLVRQLDIALNGDNAAEQASLVDIVAQVEKMQINGQIKTLP